MLDKRQQFQGKIESAVVYLGVLFQRRSIEKLIANVSKEVLYEM